MSEPGEIRWTWCYGLSRLTNSNERWARLRGRLSQALGGLLFSSRPKWALMPSYVATYFVDALFFTVSLLDEMEIPYIAHYGTLLGALRLRGVAPWDEDADIFLLGGNLEDIATALGPQLARHGFDTRKRKAGGAVYVRRRPWLAGQGHVGLSILPEAYAKGVAPDNPFWDAYLSADELRPIQRIPFYSSHLSGPAQPEPVLGRLYGASGSPEVMRRFFAPRISSDCEHFWAQTRPPAGHTNWPAISARFERESRSLAHATTFPWWWFNGAYNIGIQRLRRLGRAR